MGDGGVRSGVVCVLGTHEMVMREVNVMVRSNNLVFLLNGNMSQEHLWQHTLIQASAFFPPTGPDQMHRKPTAQPS